MQQQTAPPSQYHHYSNYRLDTRQGVQVSMSGGTSSQDSPTSASIPPARPEAQHDFDDPNVRIKIVCPQYCIRWWGVDSRRETTYILWVGRFCSFNTNLSRAIPIQCPSRLKMKTIPWATLSDISSWGSKSGQKLPPKPPYLPPALSLFLSDN